MTDKQDKLLFKLIHEELEEIRDRLYDIEVKLSMREKVEDDGK